MQYTFQFVDSIQASPTVRLDLNNWPFLTDHNGLNIDPAPVRRIVASSMLTDGDLITRTAWGNRTLILPVRLIASSVDAAATQIQALARELCRERNFIRINLGGTKNYYFKTYAAPDYQVKLIRMFADTPTVLLTIPADPFAFGEEQTLSPITVNNDPTAGSNGMFFDVSSVMGDVDTPLNLALVHSAAATRTMAIGLRRRGTVTSTPFRLPVETALTLITDTTLPGADATAIGTGSAYARIAFANTSNPKIRGKFPAAANLNTRGRYRVFARVRKSVITDPIQLWITWGGNGGTGTIVNRAVAVPNGLSGWMYVDLDRMQYPINNDPVSDGMSGIELSVEGHNICIHALRGSGTTNLDVDELFLVPADDEFLFASYFFSPVTESHSAMVIDSTNRMIYAIGGSGQIMSQTLGGIPYLAGAQLTARPGVTNRYYVIQNTNGAGGNDLKGDTVQVTPSYFPAYTWIRPATT